MKIANIDRKVRIFWTTWGISIKISGNTWLINSKKEPRPLFRRYIFGKTTGSQADPPSPVFSGLNINTQKLNSSLVNENGEIYPFHSCSIAISYSKSIPDSFKWKKVSLNDRREKIHSSISSGDRPQLNDTIKLYSNLCVTKLITKKQQHNSTARQNWQRSTYYFH